MTQQIWLWFHTPAGILIALGVPILAAIIWLIKIRQGENETW